MTPYDPRTKLAIKTALMAFLYDPADVQIDKRIERLVLRNAIDSKAGCRAMTYKGEIWNFEPKGTPLPRPLPRLLPALVGELENIQAEQESMQHERTVIENVIVRILNKLTDLRDCLKVFPPSMHAPLNALLAQWIHPGKQLNQDALEELLESNKEYLMMMRTRLATNLII